MILCYYCDNPVEHCPCRKHIDWCIYCDDWKTYCEGCPNYDRGIRGMKFKTGDKVIVKRSEEEGTILYYDKDTNTYDVQFQEHFCNCVYCHENYETGSFEEEDLICA